MDEEDETNYGLTVSDILADVDLFRITDALAQYQLATGNFGEGAVLSITSDVFNAFCALTVMGDGDCPHCGGELRFIETEGHELNDGDYYRPNSYVIDNYVYQCRECGEIIKSEKEL